MFEIKGSIGKYRNRWNNEPEPRIVYRNDESFVKEEEQKTENCVICKL